eukprot:1677744-Pleurochrysis_carterae.AAC.1
MWAVARCQGIEEGAHTGATAKGQGQCHTRKPRVRAAKGAGAAQAAAAREGAEDPGQGERGRTRPH